MNNNQILIEDIEGVWKYEVSGKIISFRYKGNDTYKVIQNNNTIDEVEIFFNKGNTARYSSMFFESGHLKLINEHYMLIELPSGPNVLNKIINKTT